MTLSKSINKYARPVFWLSFIISLILLFMPGSQEPGTPYVDKVAHFLLFAWLGWWGLLYFSKRFLLLSSLIFYTIMTEFIQYYFVPFRDIELLDTISGILGITISFFIYMQWIGRSSR